MTCGSCNERMPVPRFRDRASLALCGLSRCDATIADGLLCIPHVRPASLMHGSPRRCSMRACNRMLRLRAMRSAIAGDICHMPALQRACGGPRRVFSGDSVEHGRRWCQCSGAAVSQRSDAVALLMHARTVQGRGQVVQRMACGL